MTAQRQKEIVLVIGSLCTSALYFGLAVWLFEREALSSVAGLVAIVAGGIVWSAVTALALGLVSHPGSAGTVIGGTVLILLAAGALQFPVLIAAVLLLSALAAARRMIRTEMTNRIQFRTRTAFYRGNRTLILGVIVALIGLAWPTVSEQVSSDQVRLAPEQIRLILMPIEPFLSNVFPGLDLDSNKTIDQMITDGITKEVAQQAPGAVVPAQVLENGKVQSRRELSSTLGLPLTGRETLAEVIAQLANQRIRDLTQQSPLVLTAAVIILAFLTVRAFVPVFNWVALLVLSGIIWLGQFSSFTYLSRSQATIERLQL